jgi:membrane protease YdiL (CAAX protease family)
VVIYGCGKGARLNLVRSRALYQISEARSAVAAPVAPAVALPGGSCKLAAVAAGVRYSHRLEQRDAPRSGAWVALAYGGLGALGATLAEASGRSPLTTTGWWPGLLGAGSFAALASLGLGCLVAALTIRTTRALGRAGWARALHADLRPITHGLGDGPILVMALASGVGEELFFRGWLTPFAGILLSSLAFGVLHQVRGRARWAWASWAAVMGMAFATIYELTGNLIGPIVAHVIINFANLRYLRDHDPEAKPQPLGGLLSRAR